jgi:protein SCO1/2
MSGRFAVIGRLAAAAATMGVLSAGVSAQPNAPGLAPEPGIPAEQMPGVLSQVAFDQRLNEQLPLDLAFVDEAGRTVALGEYFGERPVLLAFVYYECPMLCTQVLNGIASVLATLDEKVGREFDVVAVSIDPREKPPLAAAKKAAYVDRYKRQGSEVGWHFLTGSQESIEALTKAAGFRYAWDERTQQFAHASGFAIATPAGRMSRYFFGIEYAPRDLKFALMESSEGRVGSLADKLILYCYHYDPASGSYSFIAMKAVRIGGAVTLVALLGFVAVSLRREQRARN